MLARLAAGAANLESARDIQDRPALEKAVSAISAAAAKTPNDDRAQYRLALAESYLAEVSQELRDKEAAQRAADAGIQAAERAISLKPGNAEYHRILGTLCGQAIPAVSLLAKISYGKRSQEAIQTALQKDPNLASAHLAKGVGEYYIPEAFGGGMEPAIQEFRRAIELDPRSAEAWLWLGLALRKTHHNAEARQALAKSLELNPKRIWTRQQLDKTPAQ